MSRNVKRRQKQLERKAARRKQKQRALVQQRNLSLSERLERAAAAPLLHCCISEDLWEMGIGHVLVSRELPDGRVAFVSFLVDTCCLGVKNTLADVAPRKSYDEGIYGPMCENMGLEHVAPEYARKLVEDAVAYAADLGLSPHPGYRKVPAIFGDIDSSACVEEFEFGRDGKPLFFAGPHDGPEKCRRILAVLEQTCGAGGYDFVVSVGSTMVSGEW